MLAVVVMFSCGLDYCRPMHDKSTHTFMSVRIAQRLQLHHTSPHGQPLLADWFTPSTTFATDPTRSDVLMQMSYLHKQLSSCARMHCVSVHMINLSTCAHLMFVYVVYIYVCKCRKSGAVTSGGHARTHARHRRIVCYITQATELRRLRISRNSKIVI